MRTIVGWGSVAALMTGPEGITVLRLVRGVLGVGVMAGVVALGTASFASASVVETKTTKCVTTSASKAIGKALKKAMAAKTGVDAAKVSDLQPDQVEPFAAALQMAFDAAEASGQSTAPVKAVKVTATCQGKTAADFTYDVATADGSVVARGLQGGAVLKKGTWLLDPVNACDNLSRGLGLAQIQAANACYAALGVAPTTPPCDVRDPTCRPG